MHHTVEIMRTMITMTTKTYSELIRLPTFEERLIYLQTHSPVGADTLGPYRYLAERFLQTELWKKFKREMILRDGACDLAMEDHPIRGVYQKSNGVIVKSEMAILHHIVPCTAEDFLNENMEILLNPENVITTTFRTHQQIHYGLKTVANEIYKERRPGDTCPWR